MILVVKNNITNRIKISKRMRESYIHTNVHTQNTHTYNQTWECENEIHTNRGKHNFGMEIRGYMILWSNFSSTQTHIRICDESERM